MHDNFDRLIDRRGTDSVKHDLLNRVFGTEDVLPMWVADMDFEVPECIRNAIRERVDHPVYGYTFRPERFYEIIAGWIIRRHRWNVDPGWISFSPGVVPALVFCIMAYTDPGDKILIQPPVYFPFFKVVKDHNRELVYNILVKTTDRYEMDFDDLEEKFKSGVRMMLLCHPHNPAGRVWRQRELETLAGLCVKYNVMVVSDEIHSDLLLFGNRHIPLASLGEEIAAKTVTCIAPSKTFNLAGLHSSALIIPDRDLKTRYDNMLTKLHMGGGNLFGMVAMEAAYLHGEEWLSGLISYLEKNFNYLLDFMGREIPEMVVTPLEATYLAWLDFSFMDLDDEALKKFIIEKARLGLNDGPMFGPGGHGHQRMNIATPMQNLKEGLSRLALAVKAPHI